MRRYEAVLILKPDSEEKLLADFQARLKKLLADGKATGIDTIEDEVRDLAHPIRKQPRAHFWRVGFDAEPGLVARIREEICHDEILLRQVYLQSTVEESSEDTGIGHEPETGVETEEKTVGDVEGAKEADIADSKIETQEETAEEAAEETAEEATEEAAEEATEEAAEATTEEATDETAEKAAEKTPKETAEDVVEEASKETDDEAADESAEETIDEENKNKEKEPS